MASMAMPTLITTVPKKLALDTPQAARLAVCRLYRAWLKEAPRAASIYLLDMPVGQVKARIRAEFEKSRNVQDRRVVAMLVAKGTMELDETHNVFKQKTHVMRYFDEQPPVKRDFMSRFLEGRSALHLTDH